VILLSKEKLVFIVLIIGLFLIFYSWYISYPIVVNSPSDVVPNHIFPLFWLGLSIVCSTLYILAMWSKKNSLKIIATLGIIIFIYSSAYFFWFMPGSDSHYFRGLNENFIETGDLNFNEAYHSYYQWPLFFVLNKIAYIIGLDLRFFEFVLFGLFGFLYGASLYSLFHKSSRDGTCFAVLSYFIMMWWYIDYQYVPFSLGFGFLLILFMLDKRENKNSATILSMLILFASLTLTHSFLPVFFISYAFIKYILLSRDRSHVNIFLMTLIIYFTVLTFRAVEFLELSVKALIGFGSDVYGRLAQTMFVEATIPIHELAQMMSRSIFVITGLVAAIGFVILLLKRKLGYTNLALFLSGGAYALASAVLPILGTRAFAIIVIPLSFGVTYFQKTKYKKYFQYLFLIIIILFAFMPLHSSFTLTKRQVPFQTEPDYQAANFWINYYQPIERSLMVADFRTEWYLFPKVRSYNVTFEGGYEIEDYDCILYTVGLEKEFLRQNYTAESLIQKMNEYNVFYSSGRSQILVKRD